MLLYHPDAAANQILNIVDTGSRGVVRGIERQVLAFKWHLLGLAPEALAAGLERLVGENLLRRAGSAWRLTSMGYAALSAPTVAPVADAAAEPVVVPGRAPARDGGASPPPAPGPAPNPAATDAPRAARFTRANGRPTEYGLRRRLLDLFAAQGPARGAKLAQPELERLWAVAGYRADELRSGLDILLRDGYATQSRFFGRTSFKLEREAVDYLAGRAPPDWLLDDAPPLEIANLGRDSLPDDVLCLIAARAFRQDMGPLVDRAYGELDHLLGRFYIPEFARFHAFELMHRLGHAEPTERQSLVLADSGLALLARTDDAATQRLMQQSLRLLIPADVLAGETLGNLS